MSVMTYPQRLLIIRPQLWLGLMLLAAHGALAWGVEQWWQRALLLTHFGLFLIWQPMWGNESRLKAMHVMLVIAAGVFLIVSNNWWLTIFWLSVLFALIGGNVTGQHRGERLTSLLAAVYLLSFLLTWVVPQLFPDDALPDAAVWTARYGLPLLPLAILFIKVEPSRSETLKPVAVDLIYSLLLFLGVTVLILGSFVVKVVSQNDYVAALAQTLLVIAFLLVVVSWLWNPHARFGGLQQFLSSYFLSIGLPFETWMQSLANLADRESDPEKFLVCAVQEMTFLPWVSGVRWHGTASDGEVGEASRFNSQFSFRGVDFLIFTHSTLSPALTVHVKLLLRLLGDFYDAKRRELTQRNNAYTQAIYETGARLTHDVKNLLQSLRSLCAAVEGADADQAEALRALMQRQLPQITQRLQGTLEKLKAPAKPDSAQIEALQWWQNLKLRYDNKQVRFRRRGDPTNVSLPADLFDSIADNLIQNALNKSHTLTDFRIEVELSFDPEPRFSVCDNGAPVDAAIARRLFGGPVASRTGLGIGLYHAHQQAAQLNYGLVLQDNEPGKVCFVLRGTPASQSPDPHSVLWQPTRSDHPVNN